LSATDVGSHAVDSIELRLEQLVTRFEGFVEGFVILTAVDQCHEFGLVSVLLGSGLVQSPDQGHVGDDCHRHETARDEETGSQSQTNVASSVDRNRSPGTKALDEQIET
jgi:hypothetical protein